MLENRGTLHGRPYREGVQGPVLTSCAPRSVLAHMGDKWTILVMSILALTLGNLERDTLVKRHYYVEVPPRVEYEITPIGKDNAAGVGKFHIVAKGEPAGDRALLAAVRRRSVGGPVHRHDGPYLGLGDTPNMPWKT